MLIIILLMKKMFVLKICSHLILLTKHAEFAVQPLIMQGEKKSTCFCFIMAIRRDPITYYYISLYQHKDFYYFFSTGVVDTFLNSVYQVYRANKENKIQGYAEIINQQRGEIVLENKRVWLTNTYNSKHLNDFVRGELRDEIITRVVVNGQTRISSWHFKRFERLNIIVVPMFDAKKLITS